METDEISVLSFGGAGTHFGVSYIHEGPGFGTGGLGNIILNAAKVVASWDLGASCDKAIVKLLQMSSLLEKRETIIGVLLC